MESLFLSSPVEGLEAQQAQGNNLMLWWGKTQLLNMIKTCDEAARLGLFDLIKDIYEVNKEGTEDVTYYAAEAGRIDILEWAYSQNLIIIGKYTLRAAQENGHKNCVDFLESLNLKK